MVLNQILRFHVDKLSSAHVYIRMPPVCAHFDYATNFAARPTAD
jgi:hypothetical protein